MKKIILSIGLAILITGQLFGQTVTITGPQLAQPGELVVLTPVDIQDARTTWILNYPEQFEQYAVESDKLFLAMPAGRVKFTLLVIPDDTAKPIQQIPHRIQTSTDPDDDPDEPDPDPDQPDDPPPPLDDFRSSPLFAVTGQALDSVTDPDKDSNARRMMIVFRYIGNEIASDKFATVAEMMDQVRKGNQGEIDIEGFGPWSEDSRRHWTAFRQAIATELDKLDDAGLLQEPDDYSIHWKAIEVALFEYLESL